MDESDAKGLEEMTEGILVASNYCVLFECNFPLHIFTTVTLTTECNPIIVPTRYPKEPNTAVQVYLQVGRDEMTNRGLVELLYQIMQEPLFYQLHPKGQFGYEVDVSPRWTYGVMGVSFNVVTSRKCTEEFGKRLDQFLIDFRDKLIAMEEESFLEHVIGMAKKQAPNFQLPYRRVQ